MIVDILFVFERVKCYEYKLIILIGGTWLYFFLLLVGLQTSIVAYSPHVCIMGILAAGPGFSHIV